ncbi:MAG: response regulator transcription factor [Anaerolineales bacterium]|nr:response regulator transcription factor [Chloroflexota bacterium]MBL6981679.1 response regulator transcription factor [Anaerolineales bacterium]
MSGELILLVDDEPNILQLARMYLEQDGYRIAAVGDGRAALDEIKRLRPALVVLDIMLPELDGLEVCRKLRAEDNPVLILMLTAKDDDIDKIVGLEMGADDYLTKPFNPRELVARVRALLRRSDRSGKSASELAPLHIGDLTIDPGSREVTLQGEKIDLRTQEFELMLTFAEHRGLVLNREQLLQLAWGYDFAGQTRTVDVHVGQLRKKLAAGTVRIETVTGVGYKLVIE